MPVTKQEVRQIAHLARLRLSPTEETRYADELSAILDYFQQLQEVDTSAVDTHADGNKSSTPLRKDVTVVSLSRDKALQNAPDTNGVFFRVPRVIG